ncbi:NACHT, LRR and PYD domains-containing protein 12-like isoform X2 [Brienomyrus brachyistius]|nr:NACHT, LRR and PYD domains-containing protein 12-like isoform X2 [Brienomyrus brachyistius]
MMESCDEERALKITLHTLRDMNQTDIADSLEKEEEKNQTISQCQQKLKNKLQKRFKCIFEGSARQGNPTLLCDIYTGLYITEGLSEGVKNEHEIPELDTASKIPLAESTTIHCNEIFKPVVGQQTSIRTVLTNGIAGIGKTVSVQKFIHDWAIGKANEDVHFIFALPFRDLNLQKDRNFSLINIIYHYFPEVEGIESTDLNEFRILLIFDGLDECRLPLDFQLNENCFDMTRQTSLDVLLTNLIKGNLLPSAQLWITSRVGASSQIPTEHVNRVTEIRGFNDLQKEEYFRRRFENEDLVKRIIKHLKMSRSLYVMCRIPVFCWISAVVLEQMLEADNSNVPTSLTQLYIYFVLIQTSIKNQKYQFQSNKEIIMKLGKLAFQQLEIENFIFYKNDFRECGIDDVYEASVYSGLCTEIVNEEDMMDEEKVYSFVHVSIQDFLAALYVSYTYKSTKMNLLNKKQSGIREELFDFHKSVIDKALRTRNGHLNLFLRFLLGISLNSSQNLLKDLVTDKETSSQGVEETVRYIKGIIKDETYPEMSINLFYCLNELGDNSLVEEVQNYLRSGKLSRKKLSPAQWSALVFVLLTSENIDHVFDLKKYSRSEEALLRLIPVVKFSRTALLDHCYLTGKCCEALSFVLCSNSLHLMELDLSDNDLQDAGVQLLSIGLGDQHCKLETLRLSFCGITEKGCRFLADALHSNPSHLKELDVSYNHPGESGVKLLSDMLQNPDFKLEKLKVDHCGECWIRPGLRKYACQLKLDPNTAHRSLCLSDGDLRVTWKCQRQPYADHPERFQHVPQVLCTEALSGRCYWEAEWRGDVAEIAVTYKEIGRKEAKNGSRFGHNEKSWVLRCSAKVYSVCHNGNHIDKPVPTPHCRRVAVYLDWLAGTLTFYSVSPTKLTPLHTFHSTFSQPVYPGFGVYGSSVILWQVD